MRKLLINGKEYPFRLELGGMRLYAIKKGMKGIKTKDITDIVKDADLVKDYPILIWAGLKAGPVKKDEDFSHSPDDVEKWLEDDPAAFDRAMDLISEDTEAPEVPAGNEEKGKDDQ